MVTGEKIEEWAKRKKIEVHDALKEGTKEKSHQYWICDYCRSAIVIRPENNRMFQNGGEFDLPASRTGRGKLRVVAHSQCLNKLLKELDIYREKEAKK
ncbi:MAG: hypothetical protein IJ629_06170 [Clostridia bacterium]|nr:hypothetical protein [Clostridia bacterium]